MATKNFNLPTYQSGDVAKFMTMKGWNEAMNAIDGALSGDSGDGGILTDQAFTYVGEVAANATTATISVNGAVGDYKRIEVFSSNPALVVASATVEAGEEGKVNVTVTVTTAPTENTSLNITLVKGV